jgi:outer membrane protein, heavy metal efflux system
MYRYLIYTILFITTSANSFAQSSLDEYLKAAQQNNPGLKAKYAEFEASMQQLPQVNSLPNPSLTVAAFGQMVETRVGQQMARFSLSQMFPWFGTLEARKNVVAAQIETNFQSYQDARLELANKVKAAYYPLVELQELIRLQKENLEILATYKTIATSNFKNGTGSLSDALRVDLMTNEANTEIEILERKKKPLEFYFNTLLNRDKNESVIVTDSFGIPDKNEISRDSIFNHPKLQALRSRRASALAQESLATKDGAPELGVGFEYIITAKRKDVSIEGNGKDAYMPMVTVSLPIYRNKYKSAVKEARLMQTVYSEMEQSEENNLLSEFEKAQFETEKALVEVELFDKQTKQVQQIIDISLVTLSNSDSDGFEEILRLQQQLIKYKSNKISALKEYYTAESMLLFIAGSDLSKSNK